jgi:alkylation response protein AidB-like acyl-CoA dehydrogenase
MAYQYIAPLADMGFVIERVLDAPASWAQCSNFAELDADTASAVLAEAAKFASGVLQPINAAGDAQGCTLDSLGQVHTPKGFAEAYAAFVEGGWPALPCDPTWGGQGLPLLLDAALREMLSACNHGWNMYPDLLHGAYETIKAHGSEEIKAQYLEKVATGEWLAAMALTEPNAGSDLGALRTQGVLQADGSLALTGNKIFISGAEHDLTPNILHLVLFRFADAPPGSKGLSLALVPKFLPVLASAAPPTGKSTSTAPSAAASSAAGSLGPRNTWRCEGLEHKMGIHGSATCQVRYEGATGWLLGEPGRGLQAMFLMMNSARLHVGLQGLGHQEMATQNALRYAFEREQFKSTIATQPAMRHSLLRLAAMVQGQRVIAYRAALAIDESHHHADPTRRQAAGALAAVLTPIVKTFCTHHGFQSASTALQVFGGYGYVRDYGVEQTLRDSRIAMIYEGTNEIQAIDLLQRKVLADGAQALNAFLAECEAEAVRCEAFAPLADFAAALRAELGAARNATTALVAGTAQDPQWPLRVADDYLMGLSHTLLAWAFAASARAAADHQDIAFANAKTQCMRYGLQWLLPQAATRWQRVQAQGAALPQLSAPAP